MPSTLENLARRSGILSSFVDARGRKRRTAGQTQIALLAAMGLDASTENKARSCLTELDRRDWVNVLPPVTVHRGHGPPAIELTLPSDTAEIAWSMRLENGRRLRGRVVLEPLEILGKKTLGGISYTRLRLVLDADVPYGYHTLSVQPGGARMTLIVTPAKCWLPREVSSGSRLWGVTAQLYLLRSRRNWGIGDFGDLHSLVDIVKPLRADLVGLNPLHALFPDNPEHASPYSPASRLLLNVLNIDVAQLSRRVKSDAARRLMATQAFRRKLSRCRAAIYVDYREVAELKLQVLRILFDAARSRRRSGAWKAYERFECEASGAVRRACLFLSLRDYFSGKSPELADWRRWPREFQNPGSRAVEVFAGEHPDLVSFQMWLQYVADAQLEAAAASAASMAVGLYRDLAVGADPAGAETWSNQRSVVSEAQVGAPPDIYNPPGQDWGLPPFHPRALREEGYRSFVDLVRANMRHAGGLRIDHVMGLLQLYWVPQGRRPKDGAYVEYPIDDLVGILALESHRHECIVVGEDLGTVPEGFRERMSRANILSYRVLFFERDEQGFLPPAAYPELAVAVVSSHDLPTLRAWWDESDLDLKKELGLFPTPKHRRVARQERKRDKAQLHRALQREGLAEHAPLGTSGLFASAHAFLGRTNCALATVQLDDITAETEPVNVPTTTDERRNWRRRQSLTLEQIAKSRRLALVARIFGEERSYRPPLAPKRRRRRS